MHPYDRANSFARNKTIIIDTETTGLDPKTNEILSLSIIDRNGKVLFDHLIKPTHRKRWPNAQEINGISPSDVKDEKTIQEYMNEIAPFFDGSYLIVGYNVKYDLDMLKANGVKMGKIKSFDVMREAQKILHRRVKLVECADIFGYGSFKAHGSLEDVKATAFCFETLLSNELYRAVANREDAETVIQRNNQTPSDQTQDSGDTGCGLLLFIVVFALLALVVIFMFTCSR